MGEIAESAYRFEREVNAGERIVVGVNAFTEGNGSSDAELLRVGQETEDDQLARLAAARSGRDSEAVAASLGRVVADATDTGVNLMPSLVRAVEARATVGEIVEALEGVFGTYVETAVV
jgi:methylmalonyl-CoA mutase N-terminal domain/subunit